MNSFNCTAPHQNHINIQSKQHHFYGVAKKKHKTLTSSNRINFAQIAKINFQKAFSSQKESVFLIDLSFCMLSLVNWMVAW